MVNLFKSLCPGMGQGHFETQVDQHGVALWFQGPEVVLDWGRKDPQHGSALCLCPAWGEGTLLGL